MFTPDPSKTYIMGISGGKDSTALWAYLKFELKLPNLIATFADTGWEHEITYEYLDYLEGKLGKIRRLMNPRYPRGMVDLAIVKKRFPSPTTRFCTEHLKMKPSRRFLRKALAMGVVTDPVMVAGVRAEESPARARMAPYVEVDEYYKVPQWRPILDWTWQDVFAIHKKYDIKPNPLYLKGMSRVGCMPCVMANRRELAQIAIRMPEVFDKIEEAESQVNRGGHRSSFWRAEEIPARHCSREWAHPETGVVYKIPTPADMRRYVLLSKEGKRAPKEQLDMFQAFAAFGEPENQDLGTCSSIYGLCE